MFTFSPAQASGKPLWDFGPSFDEIASTLTISAIRHRLRGGNCSRMLPSVIGGPWGIIRPCADPASNCPLMTLQVP